ncbi:MAG: hypothetical protein JXR56_02610 [Candidatus Cloacimonetes bacterium]|nr:hypothetical protein [Candidatus Cloacimonadota bacterium]
MSRQSKLIELNSWFKLLFVILTAYTVSVSTVLVNMFLFTIAWLHTGDHGLLTQWKRTLIKFLPFFIAYHLLGLISSIPFPTQILFSCRIVFFLYLSNFLLRSFSLDSVIADAGILKRNPLFRGLVHFILNTSSFIHEFSTANKQLTETGNRDIIKKGIDLLIVSLAGAWENKELINESSLERLDEAMSSPSRQFKLSNISLLFPIILDLMIIFDLPFNYDQIFSSIRI